MLTPAKMAAHRERISDTRRAISAVNDDRAFWRAHIGNEPLIWSGRPEQGFRISPDGQWMTGVTLFLSLLAFGYFAVFTGNDLMWLVLPFLIGANLLVSAMVLLRAKLDQRNRQARRYAITPTRALATRNIHEGRLRSLDLGPDTKIVFYPEGAHAQGTFKIRDDSDGYTVLGLANQDEDGTVTSSIQFERLSQNQAEKVAGLLKKKGLVP